MNRLLKLAIGGGVLAVIAVAAVIVAFKLHGQDAHLATEAPQIPAAAAAAPTSASAPAASSTTTTTAGTTAPAGTQHFVIDSSQSTAKFVVKETLRGVANTTTVGQTSAITGDIFVTPSGLVPSTKSSFKVDLTTLKTDQNQRDNFIKSNTLQTSRFPTATFTIDSISGFPNAYTEGSEVQLSLSGTLNVHGVDRPTTWTVKARQAGSVLTATADADVKMSDFGMTPPDVGIAKAQDDVHLQVVLVSNRIEG